MNGCESWSDVVAGILEHANFASPCTPASSPLSGDRDTEEMAKLAASMATRKREFASPTSSIFAMNSACSRGLSAMAKTLSPLPVRNEQFLVESSQNLAAVSSPQALPSASSAEVKTSASTMSTCLLRSAMSAIPVIFHPHYSEPPLLHGAVEYHRHHRHHRPGDPTHSRSNLVPPLHINLTPSH